MCAQAVLSDAALRGATVMLMRPVAADGPLRRRLQARGARVLQVPGFSLRGRDDDAARKHLRQALAATRVIFTSPAAVRFAARLLPLVPMGSVLAVGGGTARALQAQGVEHVQVPAQQRSEGLLALPALQSVQGQSVGLVGAAGGRRLLPDALVARGARLFEAHVYVRSAARLDARHRRALETASAPLYVLISSAGALAHVSAGLGPANWQALTERACAVVSSERLAGLAQASGFRRYVLAASARPEDLLAATCAAHRAPD
ncbi:uroporphyrinogen-III synthase [Oleiagrimonas sp. C23AA]|uniref:uroporphyrinogen-III synthase n=1 Tax=Oleiagrimonas sp. C23AA TaxID=2719047 RepID=UPI0014200365|nr:uroporphyrinogen-III synthase [Oleiagrimonas sp. C23AA]NII12323.1 uroporphyrinogen-III synthase [Oleiagrimonas sp. C23AA]